MFRKLLLAFVLLAPFAFNLRAQQSDAKMKAYIDNLLSKMSLDEKIGQLNLPVSGDITTGQAGSSDIAKKIESGQVGGLFNIKSVAKIREVQKLAVEKSRLKIPLLFGMDVIHGYETVFPIPLGLSASWDMKLIERSAQIAADEASSDGINWTFSPMVDITRDPRWGRVSEGNGEDPYLGSQIAKAMVHGYQQDNLSAPNTLMSCVKHYALYGAAESGRDYNTVDMSHQRMYNDYFPPYKAAVDAGVGSVMASFNEVDGVPATGNKWLLTDVLRKQWGFKGLVVTDYTGINEMIAHGVGDLQAVSAQALNAGVDMDMVGEGFLTTLKKSLQEGKVTEAEITEACRLILEAKYKLGLFEDPYRYCVPGRAEKSVFSADHRAEARKLSAECFVLLKNDGLLPLKKSGTIALVGPLADAKENMTGTWSVAADFSKSVSLLAGMKEVLGSNVNVLYAKGSNLTADPKLEERGTLFGKTLHRDDRSEKELLDEALAIAAKSDIIIAAVGESAEMTGESASRTDIGIPETQRKMLEALKATGKPVVVVLFTGRPLTLDWEQENMPAILNVWFAGSEAGYSITDALFGDVNPSGKLTMTFPQNVGQVPLYYAHKNTGRPLPEGQWFQKFRSNYLDVSNDPLYPFGFGLSYTSFSYGDIKLSDSTLKNGSIKASIQVTNTGTVAGKEVVQLYLQDVVGSVTRPVKELKGFQKILLQPGESKTVDFEISPEMLKFYNYDLQYLAEPGEFNIFIGGNSRDTKTKSFMYQP